jgi:hypothetical protein
MFQNVSTQRTKIRIAYTATLFLTFGLAAAHAQNLVADNESASSSSAATPVVVGPVLPSDPGQQGGPAYLAQGPQAYPYVVQENHSYWHGHSVDIGASATGRYQQVVTNQQPAVTSPTEGVGALLNVRLHPVSWAGLEFNYSYNRFGQRFYSAATGAQTARIDQDEHEATAGYVIHIKSPYVQPFVVLGGGAINFRGTKANPQFDNQWRGTYMYEVGFDFVSKKAPHFGIRVQEHGLFYKAEDYHVANLRSNGYIHQAMPSAGIFYRF